MSEQPYPVSAQSGLDAPTRTARGTTRECAVCGNPNAGVPPYEGGTLRRLDPHGIEKIGGMRVFGNLRARQICGMAVAIVLVMAGAAVQPDAAAAAAANKLVHQRAARAGLAKRREAPARRFTARGPDPRSCAAPPPASFGRRRRRDSI